MARPGSKTPTDAELQVLDVLWLKGPCTLRQIQEALPSDRTRAAVHTRLRAMLDKKLLKIKRRPKGEGGSVYVPTYSRAGTMGQMFRRLAGMFGGSPRLLIQGLLRGGQLKEHELEDLREILRQSKKGEQGKKGDE